MTSLTETAIEIKGQLYTIAPAVGQWVGLPTIGLVKEDGTSYHVTFGNGRASCTCPDYTYRHTHLEHTAGCKHCVACVEAGLFEVEPVACEPEPVACEWASKSTAFETAIPPTPAWFLALATQASEPIATVLSPSEEAREALSRPDMTIMVWTDEAGGYWHQVPNPAHPANSASRKVDSKPVKATRRGKGRPTKYATVDWASIADRHARGESERSLAESTGIPRTVIQARLKRMRVPA